MLDETYITHSTIYCLNNIYLIPATEIHYQPLYDLLLMYPSYFDDANQLQNFNDFKYWFNSTAISPIVGTFNNQIVGCGYLSSINNNNGCVNLFMNRKIIQFKDAIQIFKKCMNYYLDKYDLKMLYAFVRSNNKPCLFLLNLLGFKITNEKIIEIYNKKEIICKLAIYLNM